MGTGTKPGEILLREVGRSVVPWAAIATSALCRTAVPCRWGFVEAFFHFRTRVLTNQSAQERRVSVRLGTEWRGDVLVCSRMTGVGGSGVVFNMRQDAT